MITETEQRMIDIIKECEGIVDSSYLKTEDAKRILYAGYSLLQHHQRVKESRDKWKNKYEKLKNDR